MPNATTKRPRAHIIEDLSLNFVELFFLEKGHAFNRPKDYGTDAVVSTFNSKGYAENGDIRIQVKASDGLRFLKKKSYISFSIKRKHYTLWTKEVSPMILILYDAKHAKAYWLYLQPYFAQRRKPKKGTKTITVQVPATNKLTRRTVGYLHQRSRAIQQQAQGAIQHVA